MDKRLMNSAVLILLCAFSQMLSAQDLNFTVVSGDTACDNPNHCVDIEVTGFEDIATFQFLAYYDTLALDYLAYNTLLPVGHEVEEPVNGEIRISWANFSGATFGDNTAVIELCFQPTGQSGSTAIDLNEDPPNGFPAIAASIGFTRVYVLDTDYFLNDGSFNITDTQNPTISCPNDTLLVTSGAVPVTNIAPAMFADNCLVDMVSYTFSSNTPGSGMNDASGSVFNPGITTVTYEVEDAAGNTASCPFDVEIDASIPVDTNFTFVPEISLDCENGTVEMCMTVTNADSIVSIGVYWTWDETQTEYQSNNVVVTAGSGFVADGFANTGAAGFIWTFTPTPTGPTGHSFADGDSLFCVQHDILNPLDTNIFTIQDLQLVDIEVTSTEDGFPADTIPYNIEIETYNVTDLTPPTFSNCPIDVTINAATGTCNAVHTWISPTGMDECIANLNIDSTHASGDQFPVGTTTVTYSMTDLGGNVGTCSFDVTVLDVDNPILTCRTDTTVTGIGPIAVTNLPVVASDLCGAVTVTWAQTGATLGTGTLDVSGEDFEDGMTTVTYYAEDADGNIDSCSFIVTVEPGAFPDIDCPNDTIVGNSGTNCFATVMDLQPTLNTAAASIDSVHYNLSGATSGSGLNDVSGVQFNVGATTVTYYLTDILGAIDSCDFLVTVQDTAAPIVSCPALDQFSNAPGQCGIVVNNNLFPTASDNCGNVNISYVFTGATLGTGSNDPTGSFFNVGTTNIVYTISDDAGNMNTCSVVVIVNDEEIPTVSCPSDTTFMIPFGATSGILNDIDAITSDNCPDPATSYAVDGITPFSGMGNASGQMFDLGINTVTYYVTDSTGNIDSCEFIVTVDNLPIGDLVDCPNDTAVVSSIIGCGAIVNGIAPNILVDLALIDSVTYVIDGSTMAIDSGDVSGTFFNTSISTIKYYVIDINGNIDSCQFTVTVNDTTDPTWIGCPADTIPFYVDSLSCRQIANWSTPIPNDNCGVQVISNSHMPGDTFDIGFTTVTYTAEDAAMNMGTCEFVVWVQDSFPPTFTCPSDTVLTTTNGCGMTVTWPAINAMDNCAVDSIHSTQNSGDEFPVGVTTVVYTVIDDSGNTTQCSFTITVNDGAAPIIVCPAEIIVRVDGTIVSDPSNLVTSTQPSTNCDDIIINFNAPDAADACDGIVTATQISGMASGSAFIQGDELLEFVAVDMNGNSDTCRFDLTVLPLSDVNVEIVGSNPVCPGTDAQLNIINPLVGAVYSWTGPNGFLSSGVTATIFDFDVNNVGLYTVECNAGGSCNAQGTIQVNIADAPNISADSNSPLCSSGSSDLILTGIDNGGISISSWSWTGPNGFASIDQSPVINSAGSAESGTYTLTAVGSNGCSSSVDVEVTVEDTQTPNINSDCHGVICLGESCTLLGTEFSTTPDAYIWTANPSGDAGLPINTNQSTIEVTPTAPGIYIYNYQVTLAGGCETGVASFVLTVEDSPIAVDDNFTTTQNVALSNVSVISNDAVNPILGFSIDIVSNPSNGIATLTSDGLLTYIPAEGFIGADALTYEICSNCDTENCSTATVNIAVDFNGDECEIPTIITPNNDGRNDVLIIDCILSGDFSTNKIAIYNQWGDKVFDANPYNNNWGGTYEGNPLPDGTYFYIFDDGRGGEISKGAITIFR